MLFIFIYICRAIISAKKESERERLLYFSRSICVHRGDAGTWYENWLSRYTVAARTLLIRGA